MMLKTALLVGVLLLGLSPLVPAQDPPAPVGDAPSEAAPGQEERSGAAEEPPPSDVPDEQESAVKKAPTRAEREGAAFEDTGAIPSEVAEEAPAETEPEPPTEARPEAPPGAALEDEPDEAAKLREDELGFYASLRLVGGTNTETTAVRDNASRFGLFGARDFSPGWGFYARSELGINVVEAFDRALNPKANAPEGSGNLFLRVGYLGIDGPLGRASLGKQWSAYYAVAVFTDRFPYSGGLSTASFNAGTDGGATGTGRAGSSLLYTLEKGGLGLRLQSQSGGRRVPGGTAETYRWSGGGSLIYEWDWGFEVGAAFNYAPVNEITEELEAIGIDGPARAVVAGFKLQTGPVYLGANYVEHRNHDTDDVGNYFDGRGGEFLLRFSWHDRYRLSAGINYLEAFGRDKGLLYDIRVALFSLEYSFHDPTFQNVVYAQVLIDESNDSLGNPYPNVYVVGVRYSFDF
jgi:predicted porin